MILNAINVRIGHLGSNRSRVAKSVRGLSKSALYRFLDGKGNTSVANIDEVLQACGLAVVPAESVRRNKATGYQVPRGAKVKEQS